MKKKDTGVRVTKDQVTGRLESVVLDDVQRSFERVVGYIDGVMLSLRSNPDRERLCHKLIDRIGQMLPHTEG